jgi:hypothetical protein
MSYNLTRLFFITFIYTMNYIILYYTNINYKARERAYLEEESNITVLAFYSESRAHVF